MAERHRACHGWHSGDERNRLMVAHWLALLDCLRADRKGVTAMEYGVIAAGIIFVVATAAIALGSDITALFTTLGSKL